MLYISKFTFYFTSHCFSVTVHVFNIFIHGNFFLVIIDLTIIEIRHVNIIGNYKCLYLRQYFYNNKSIYVLRNLLYLF